MSAENESDLAALNEAYDLYERKRYTDAVDRFQVLFARGSNLAGVYLGYMYYHGLGVAPDLDKARQFYLEAANRGAAEAQYYVGVIHHRNNEFSEALNWYTKAAEQSYVSAMYWIYSMYIRGEAATVNKGKAQYYLEEAAKGGHVYAQRKVASQLLRGTQGVRGFLKGILMIVKLVPRAFTIAYRDPDSRLIH